MKVYQVWNDEPQVWNDEPYVGIFLQAIFSTEAKAGEYIERMKSERPGLYYDEYELDSE